MLNSHGCHEVPELADEQRILTGMGVDNQNLLIHLGSSSPQQPSAHGKFPPFSALRTDCPKRK
jgi:hypothetical protein